MKNTLQIVACVVLCLGAALGWLYHDFSTRPVTESSQKEIASIIAREPSLRPMYAEAKKDGSISKLEAWQIIRESNKLLEQRFSE